jgi:hypothetical protein
MQQVRYPSPAAIRETVAYRDGLLFWKRPKGPAKADTPIGSLARNGYLVVNWPTESGRKKLLVHRIVWLFFNDELPPLVDHINRNKLDNRIENLRSLSYTENARNCGDKHYKNDLPRGVTIQRGKYKAQIKLGGKTKHIGIYLTVNQASEAYLAFVAKLRANGHIEGQPSGHE